LIVKNLDIIIINNNYYKMESLKSLVKEFVWETKHVKNE